MISVIWTILLVAFASCNAESTKLHPLILQHNSKSDEQFILHGGEEFYELDNGVFGKYGVNDTIQEILIDSALTDWGDLFGCDFSQPSPIYDESTWEIYRSTYYEVTKNEPVPSSPVNGKQTGFQVPIEVHYIEGKGRGIIASEFIRKGDLVYSGTINAAEFWDLETFWKYINALPSELLCDPLQWVYTADLANYDESTQSKPVLCFEMDEGALFNDDSWDYNAGCHPMFDDWMVPPEICMKNFYALENIYPGEEILLSYDDFVSDLPFEDIWPEISVPVNHLRPPYKLSENPQLHH